jgi:DNA-directed RNA polymerase subunit alpha
VSYVRIDGVTHEFTTIKGMTEDVVDLIINLKSLRVRLTDPQAESATVRLQVKGPKQVTAADFAPSSEIEFADPSHVLATLGPDGKLGIEVVIERGRGYVPAERKPTDQRPLGTIAVDSIFTPIKKLHYQVDHTRVGGMTNFDKLTIQITTDGTLHPRDALAQATTMLAEHLATIARFTGQTIEVGSLPAPTPVVAEPVKRRSPSKRATRDGAKRPARVSATK